MKFSPLDGCIAIDFPAFELQRLYMKG